MKYFLLLLFISLTFFTQPAHSQDYNKKQNNIWAFGNSVKLNFNGSTPIVSPTSIMPISWASGSVCDSKGNLLFYTDGDNFYDKNNSIMPNGWDITGLAYYSGVILFSPTRGSWHGAQIIPVPGTPHKYYVFSTIGAFVNNYLPPQYGYMYYSVVDMTLNGGLGDVVPGQKAIL